MEFTSKERVNAAMNLQRPDRVPLMESADCFFP